MKFRLIASTLFSICAVASVPAQPPSPPNAPGRPSLTVFRRSSVFPIRTGHTREQKRRLKAAPEDVLRHERFLAAERTGIFRLMPDLGCHENTNVVRADEVCLAAIPEGSSYSFREREHTLEPLADLRLGGGHLISDGVLSHGMLVNLGPVALEAVTLDTDGLKFLRTYLPPVLSQEVQRHYVQMARGVRIGRHEYRKALPVDEHATYALRVVAYRGSAFRSFRGYRFDLLAGDKRVDLTIAFRIVRRDADGALTILWKELGRREAPRLKYPKRKN